jgi:hypothetical protein
MRAFDIHSYAGGSEKPTRKRREDDRKLPAKGDDVEYFNERPDHP